jgi:hypothetical protein
MCPTSFPNPNALGQSSDDVKCCKTHIITDSILTDFIFKALPGTRALTARWVTLSASSYDPFGSTAQLKRAHGVASLTLGWTAGPRTSTSTAIR